MCSKALPVQYLALLLLTFLGSTAVFAADITTRDGTTYRNVEVTGVDPDGIHVMHSKGVAKLRFEELPHALQQQYHYDAAKAAAYRKHVEDSKKAATAQATAAQQQQERQASAARDQRNPEIQQAQDAERRRAEDEKAPVFAAELNKAAVANADDFLAALKIFELAEGKQAVASASWSANLGEIPVLLEQEKLFEGMLSTDAPGVTGYKRLIQAKVQSKGAAALTDKYLLVSYKDMLTGRWKVWEMRKIGGIDVDYEISAAKNHLGDTQFVADQSNYRNYAYWLALGGQVVAATQVLETALTLDMRHSSESFPRAHCQTEIQKLRSILAP